jgi:hypothetical protein
MHRSSSFIGFANIVLAATPILALMVAYVTPLTH